MGILSNTVSVCQFKVTGDMPPGDLYQWASERLARYGFQPIDEGAAELSIGWVHLDDQRANDFSTPAAFWRDHYLVFTLRRDQRKLPAALLKAYQRRAEDDFLAANAGFARVPKRKREEMKEAVRGLLLAKTLPVPSSWDVVWDTRSGIVTFTSLSPAIMDLFESQFKKTFDGLRLILIHPYSRAERVAATDLAEALAKANEASTEAALDLIRSNRWLGQEFLLWLLYRTMNDSSEYRITRPGPATEGEGFVAYLNDRLVLMCAAEEGVQKITVAGPQDHFSEVCTALRNGKRIVDATLYLEQNEHLWKLTLKGEMFHFASYRAPAVQIERDNTVDEISEREAVFYERMHVVEHGLQLFDSLYAEFLRIRLTDARQAEEERIATWLAAE